MNWLVMAGGRQLGPVSQDELVVWAREGRLRSEDLVWRSGMPQWVRAGTAAELTALVPELAIAPEVPMGDDPMLRALLPVGRSGWAIAAGYLGLFSILLVPAPFALLSGVLAIRNIRRNPKLHGMGRAIFGIVAGALGSLLLLLLFVLRNR
ncbi:MAG: DUF4339 domain-containing protein [Thermoanaerobaculia bacterium]